VALRRLAPLLNLIAAAVVLLGAAFADGRPSVFYDSDSYELSGRNFMEIIQKAPESLTFRMKPGLDIGDDPVASDDDLDPAMMGARSPWYGLFMRGLYKTGDIRALFGGHRHGSLWVLAVAQALIGAWVLRLLWRSVAPKAPGWTYMALVGVLTTVSTLPFFVSFAMPDVFAGFMSAGVVVAMLYFDRIKRWEAVLLWLLLVACMSFHGSDPLLATPLVLGSALLAWRLGASLKGQALRALYVFSALVVGVSLVKVYAYAFELRTGRELHPPPFIMARLLVDGPAKRYLLTHCTDDSTPFVACRYRFQPMPDTDTVLWSDDYDLGVFNIADARTRLLMEQQENKFALAVVAYDPIGQIVASTKNWIIQLGDFWVEDPVRNPMVILRDPYWGTTALKQLIPNSSECKPMGPGCAPPFYMTPLAIWHGLWIVAGLGFLGWRLSRRDVREALLRKPDWSSPTVRLCAAAATLVAAVLINAGICGVFSGTFTRYEARVVWLVPMTAGLVACVLVPHRALATLGRWMLRAEAKLRALAAGAKLPGWAEPVLARVRAHPLGRRIDAQFLQFGFVGAFGFAVDYAALLLLTGVVQFNAILARILSFAIAVFATWVVNRTWTFREHARDDRRAEEASSYFAVQCTAFVLNMGVFTALIAAFPGFDHGLALFPPTFAGAIAGLGINYLGSRHLVFRAARATTPAE
jgi:putative flippase GtrA